MLEIYLLTWAPYSESKIHDHSKNGCYMKILEGELQEYQYDCTNIKLMATKSYKKNNITYINNSMYYHKIINNTDKPTYSLHIYSPPEHNTKFYTSIV